jgi:hypothetical protein
MFVCNDCHDERCPMEFIETFNRSYGKCEGCGKGAACYDCHGYKSLPPKPLPQTVVHLRAGTKAVCSAEPGVNWRDAYDAFAPDDLPNTVTCVNCRDMLHVNANKHLAWCKERALAYVEQGDLVNAFASMASDMRKEPATHEHPGLQLGALLLVNGHLDTPAKMRDWIEGFN